MLCDLDSWRWGRTLLRDRKWSIIRLFGEWIRNRKWRCSKNRLDWWSGQSRLSNLRFWRTSSTMNYWYFDWTQELSTRWVSSRNNCILTFWSSIHCTFRTSKTILTHLSTEEWSDWSQRLEEDAIGWLSFCHMGLEFGLGLVWSVVWCNWRHLVFWWIHWD